MRRLSLERFTVGAFNLLERFTIGADYLGVLLNALFLLLKPSNRRAERFLSSSITWVYISKVILISLCPKFSEITLISSPLNLRAPPMCPAAAPPLPDALSPPPPPGARPALVPRHRAHRRQTFHQVAERRIIIPRLHDPFHRLQPRRRA